VRAGHLLIPVMHIDVHHLYSRKPLALGDEATPSYGHGPQHMELRVRVFQKLLHARHEVLAEELHLPDFVEDEDRVPVASLLRKHTVQDGERKPLELLVEARKFRVVVWLNSG